MTDRQRQRLRSFCRKEAKDAREKLDVKAHAFERGYFLGLAHAYELLAKHKLKSENRRNP